MREKLERALGPYLLRHRFLKPGTDIAMIDIKSLDLVALAESKDVIVLEKCEVEHTPSFTKLIHRGPGSIGYDYLLISGHHGTPGPALAIIVPLATAKDREGR